MKVGIIGGGPVGTTTAILLKSQCPDIQVHLFEQRPEFTRSQIVLLDKTTWGIFPTSLRESLQNHGCFIRPPPVDTTGRCYRRQSRDQKLLFSIRISILEQTLWNYAKQVGVQMHRPKSEKKEIKISDPRLRKFDILIGAGGKNDILRKYLKIPLQEEKVSTAVILTWNPPQNVSYNSTTKNSRRRRSSQDRYRMFRSRDTNYYATIQLTPDEERRLEEEGSVKTLSDIQDSQILKTFDNIFKYYNLRESEYPENGKITLVPITLYSANESVGFVHLPNSKHTTLVFLVGDAVNGVHFFSGTGVNTGIKMAAKVSDGICDIYQGKGSEKKVVSDIRKHVNNYINQAREKSRKVILNSDALGQCKKNTLKELRDLARRHNYVGINNLSKNEMCLVMGAEFIE